MLQQQASIWVRTLRGKIYSGGRLSRSEDRCFQNISSRLRCTAVSTTRHKPLLSREGEREAHDHRHLDALRYLVHSRVPPKPYHRLLSLLLPQLSTISCTLYQEIVGTHMTLSIKSIANWGLLQWIAASILLSAAIWCLWSHVIVEWGSTSSRLQLALFQILFAFRGGYLGQFVIGVTGGLIAIVRLLHNLDCTDSCMSLFQTFLTFVAEPTSDGLHLHHWFTAYLMAMM